MNIWQWVDDVEQAALKRGDYRLAELIDSLPGYVVDDQYDKVDAMVSEGIHLARQLNHQWLEIFFRHWHLQSRVLYRQQVKACLPEAIRLVDFCYQEETQDCPQSICAIQNLARCYEGIDHLAYAQDRLAVAEQTLTKINPRWPCFACIGSEYTSALIDRGKPELALAWIDQARQQARAANAEEYQRLLLSSKVDALLAMEDWQQALDCVQANKNPDGGDSFIRDQKNNLAIIFTALERYDEALVTRLDFAEIKAGVAYFDKWSWGTYLLVKAGQLDNSEEIDRQFESMASTMVAQGVLRRAIEISHRQAELALLREDAISVQACIARIQSLVADLSQDLGAKADLDALCERAQVLFT